MPDWIVDLYISFFGSDVLIAPEYILVTILTGWLVYRLGRGHGDRSRGFWHWLTPREFYRHKSSRIDLELFTISRMMVFFGFFGPITLTTGMAIAVARVTGGGPSTPPALSPLMLAFLLWLVSDFATYWIHRAHHQIRLIWPLHAVHHSAEVLTPITAFRQHPLAIVNITVFATLLIGVAQGLLIGALDPGALVAEVAGANAFAVGARLALANFHHSHIWISFGPVLERIVISPAQHQIHHSVDPAHHNRNYGQTLAIWDWMFGTLYVIRGHEDLRFGLEDEADASLMTQRLDQMLADPVKRLWPTRR
jgi:sterol desaturase/sphingolipid hydroxylase (fatty acid hydroxylase superfamily)